jgi:hypothetical protein
MRRELCPFLMVCCLVCGCVDALRTIGCGPNAEPETYVFATGRVSEAAADEMPPHPAGETASASLSTACGGYQDGPPDAQTLILFCPHDSTVAGLATNIQVRFGPFDLRTFAASDSAHVDVQIDHFPRSGGSCSTTVTGAGALMVTQANGQAAARPAYVTADFSRQAAFTLDFDGASVSWIPGSNEITDCSRPQLGRVHLTGTLDQTASDYGERPICH